MLMNCALTIMATGYSCIRRFLCLFNLLIWLTGSCILGIGIWLFVSYDTYARILPSYHLFSADNLAIFIGALTFLVAFCGCCGSWFQSKCLLVTYLGAIIFIMVIEIILGAACFAFQSQISQTLQAELLEGIEQRYYLNDTNGILSTWDHIQSNFHCCGVNNHTDWYHINAWPDKMRVPASCCKSLNRTSDATEGSNHQCGFDAPADVKLGRIYRHGCYQKLQYFLLTNIHGVGITSIVFAFVQFISLVSAFLIVYTMDYKKDRRKLKALSSRPTYNRIRTM